MINNYYSNTKYYVVSTSLHGAELISILKLDEGTLVAFPENVSELKPSVSPCMRPLLSHFLRIIPRSAKSGTPFEILKHYYIY